MGDTGIGLKYLDAARVTHSAGTLAGVRACSPDGETLGTLDGVVVEPAARRLKFYVVRGAHQGDRRRYLIQSGGLDVLDSRDQTLRLEVPPAGLERLDQRTIQPFTDEDLLAALFPSTAA